MKRFYSRPLLIALSSVGVSVLSMQAIAAGFQLWEQDGASIGNFHAGYAAEARDASTAFYNPAGMVRIHNQQIVFAGVGVSSDVKYKGIVGVNTIDNFAPQNANTQGGGLSFIPALHYVTPINENNNVGFSVSAPFGAMIHYGNSTPLSYISSLVEIKVVDISPVYAVKLTNQLSFGIGPDIQKMEGKFVEKGEYVIHAFGINKLNGTGYGYHAGLLYEIEPATRFGLSYHSQVVHHLTGTSQFIGPLAEDTDLDGPVNPTSRGKLNMKLPPYTALSMFHQINPKLDIMISAIYTEWSTIKNIELQNVSGIAFAGMLPKRVSNITVTLPQYFRNTWNVSVGSNYHLTDKLFIRNGIGYDQSPVSDTYRNAQMPDKDRYVVALGGHYQATKAIGVDLGWMHVFMHKAHISPPVQVVGAEEVITSGSVSSSANVYSAQLVWNIA